MKETILRKIKIKQSSNGDVKETKKEIKDLTINKAVSIVPDVSQRDLNFNIRLNIDKRNPIDQQTAPFADVKGNKQVASLERRIRERQRLQQKLNEAPVEKKEVGRPPNPKKPGRPADPKPVGRPKTKKEKVGKKNPVGRPKQDKPLSVDEKVKKLLF